MKELEYPFDSSFLLKKRRKLKKDLLADGSQRMEKRIAVLGGSTTNDIISMLELFLLNCGIQPAFYQSEYAQYWQDAMFDNPELESFQPDLILITPSSSSSSPQPQYPRGTAAPFCIGAGGPGCTGAPVQPLQPDVGTSARSLSLSHYPEQL